MSEDILEKQLFEIIKDEDMDDFFKKLKECNITFYNSIKSE